MPQAIELYCIWLELGRAYEQLFTFETMENVFKGIFVLLNSLREYVDVVEVYPYLNTNSFPEYKRHEPLPRGWSIAIPLLEGVADVSS